MTPDARYVRNESGAFLVPLHPRPRGPYATACVGSQAYVIEPAYAPGVRVKCPICGRLAAISPKYRHVWKHDPLPSWRNGWRS